MRQSGERSAGLMRDRHAVDAALLGADGLPLGDPGQWLRGSLEIGVPKGAGFPQIPGQA